MKSENLFELHIRCDTTGITSRLAGPNMADKIVEEKEMYERHLLPQTSLLIIERDIKLHPLNWLEEMKNAYDKQHNPFNAKFNQKTNTIILDSNDPRDRLMLQFDSLEDEKGWVESSLNGASEKIYTNNTQIQPSPMMIGSLWHRGYVNILFDRTHCSYFSTVCDWIRQIGNTYNPTIISNLKGVCGDSSIYQGGFYTDDVKLLCKYCHEIFAVDLYEVAKLFITRDPQEFDIENKEINTRAHQLSRVAAIHAERGFVETAREYYQKSIKTLNGKNYQCNYIRKFENFEKYVENHGTSILSSN